MAYLIVLFGIGIWAAWPLESSTAGFIGIVFAALVFWFWLCAQIPHCRHLLLRIPAWPARRQAVVT